MTTCILASDYLLSLLTCAHFEAAVVEAPSVVILVAANEDIGEAGLAHAHGAQDDDAGAREQILIVRNTPRAWNKDQSLSLYFITILKL